MKKFIFPFLFLMLSLPAVSQNFLTVSGSVTDIVTGNPIPNHAVNIYNDSVPAGTYFYHTILTNSNGFFLDTVMFQGGVTPGTFYVSTLDCQNFLHQQIFTYTPGITQYLANFSICYNSLPCQANFFYFQGQPLVVEFSDASTGGNNIRHWDFGDGTTSTLSNPVHTYMQPGNYTVLLTIGTPGTTCYDSVFQTINVWGSSGGGCQANFIPFPDSLSQYTFHFLNQSTGNITFYNWDFGDGNSSTQINPTHSYNAPGTFTVCLTVQGDSNCFDTYCNTITINSGSGCNAAFLYSVGSGGTVTFTDLSTGNPSQWLWNFGDGTTSVMQHPTHTYSQSGNYTVSLTIGAPGTNCYDSVTQIFYIWVNGGGGCQSYFIPSPDSLDPYTIHFQNQSSGNITGYLWDFGDGYTSALMHPSHTYLAQGTYNVCLTVTGDSSCYDIYCTSVSIMGGPGCAAAFDYSIGTGKTVSFTDLSTGNPSSWFWSFGDGTSSTLQNPMHTYATQGTFMVTLTISGINCQSTATKPVYVIDTTFQHLYGQVFAGNFPVTAGVAMIFPTNPNPAGGGFYAQMPLDSNGVYYFTEVPEGSYFILAVPLESSGYLPTYFGNTIHWESSTVINLGTAENPYNISLIASDQLTVGPGSVSGVIGTGDFPLSMLDKIQMILKNENNQAIGFTQVSTDGVFGFPSLVYGTYYLLPELPGINSQQIMVTLNESQPHAEVVMTYTGNSILGLGKNNGQDVSVQVFPNPVRSNACFNISAPGEPEVTVEILDMTGRRVMTQPVRLNGESTRTAINVQSMKPGVYVYKINSGSVMLATGRLIRID